MAPSPGAPGLGHPSNHADRHKFRQGMMFMKIGFSSLVCPGWDLPKVVEQASNFGFQGVELRGLGGESHLPLVPELAGRPEEARKLFSEKKVELVCLGSSASLSSKDNDEIAGQKGVIVEYLELASRLGCPFVRVSAGEIDRRDTPERAIVRMTEAVRSLAGKASRLNVTLLVENCGDFPDSRAMWFLMDAVDHPAVQCCWNQFNAMGALELATISIPRLGSKIGLVHVCDGEFDDLGVLKAYRLPGEGSVGVSRQIELLRGIGYRGYLMFECARQRVESAPDPETALPKAAEFLKACVASKQAILSAYKGDKNAPRYAVQAVAPAIS